MSSDVNLRNQEPVPDEYPEPQQPLPRPLQVRQDDRRAFVFRTIVLLAICAVAFAICWHVFGKDAVASFLKGYWPVMIAPFVGAFLGKWAVKSLYRPTGRVVVCLYPTTHTFRAVFIPDMMFRYFEQAGNNVLYHTPGGTPVYVAEDIDTDRGYIVYSWIHELDSFSVMTREETYNNWRNVLEEVLRENLQIMDHPHVIGLGYARQCLRDHLDMIAETLGLTKRDYRRDTSFGEPEPEPEQQSEVME